MLLALVLEYGAIVFDFDNLKVLVRAAHQDQISVKDEVAGFLFGAGHDSVQEIVRPIRPAPRRLFCP